MIKNAALGGRPTSALADGHQHHASSLPLPSHLLCRSSTASLLAHLTSAVRPPDTSRRSASSTAIKSRCPKVPPHHYVATTADHLRPFSLMPHTRQGRKPAACARRGSAAADDLMPPFTSSAACHSCSTAFHCTMEGERASVRRHGGLVVAR